MAYRVLELHLVSASDLKKVTTFSRMRVYAVATISGGDPRMPTHGTQADLYGGCSPAWNAVFHFPIPAAADTRGLALHVMLRTERVFGSRVVGEVFVPIEELLAGAGADNGAATREPRPATYQVRRPRSGRVHGVLYFRYKFIDVPAATAAANKEGHQGVKYVQDDSTTEQATTVADDKAVAVAAAPVTAYPPPPQMAASAYQPYGPTYAAGYPPQSYPYAAPSQPYGYGAVPQHAAYGGYAAPKQSGGMGMGLGLGLLGGAVGGMVIGDMIGDAAADAAYDAGFSDGLSF